MISLSCTCTEGGMKIRKKYIKSTREVKVQVPFRPTSHNNLSALYLFVEIVNDAFQIIYATKR